MQRVKDWLITRDPAQPFFAFINFMEVHEPYQPPAPYDQQFMPPGISRAAARRLLAQGEPNTDSGRAQDNERAAKYFEVLKAAYDGELRYLDQQIHRLVDGLKSLDLLDNTVVIITSDHGDSLGEHEELGHRKVLYEQLVHVPLVIRHPDRFEPGSRIGAQVQAVDLYPTLLELGGVSAPIPEGARSLLDAQRKAREFSIAENTGPKSSNYLLARMIRTDRYKYIWKSNEAHELYDLLADPDERVNLITHEPEVARELSRKLHEWNNAATTAEVDATSAEYDEVVLSRLRELGYVD